jgi:hypothetical protein
MKPDWDKLMKEFAGHKSTLVGDVDCTTEGKPLCDSNGVQGFPTIKYGDPSDLEDYQGGRDFASLKKHAESLKPLCSVTNMDLCDDEGKAKIAKVQEMSTEDLQAAIDKAAADSKAASETFESEVAKLQAAYQQLQKDKEEALADIKGRGIGLMKSVLASRGSGKTEL